MYSPLATLASPFAGGVKFSVHWDTLIPSGDFPYLNIWTDITIFDPATIIDKATYEKSTQLSQGVKFVFVNGQLEFEGDHLTGIQAGRVLRG